MFNYGGNEPLGPRLREGNCVGAGKNARRLESRRRRGRAGPTALMTAIKINLRGRRLTRKLNSSLALSCPPGPRAAPARVMAAGSPLSRDRTRSLD